MMNIKIIFAGNIFLLLLVFVFYSKSSFAQGKNYNWLLGYNLNIDPYTTYTKARLNIDSLNTSIIPESRKMQMRVCQGNISDENGNILMATNGCWIANALQDTMLNGSGINPGTFTDTWCGTAPEGLPLPNTHVFLPWPDDTSKYALFHQTGNDFLNFMSSEMYLTTIDMTLDNGNGGVSSKNSIVVSDTLSPAIAVCKHANGRDWWIINFKENSDVVYAGLFTPQGYSIINTQHLTTFNVLYTGQPVFSPDGSKFAYSNFNGSVGNYVNEVNLFDFDRCTGNFSNPKIINVSDSIAGYGLAFGPSGKYLYSSSFHRVFQINTDTVPVFVDTVATYDGYSSPNPPLNTDFWLMHLGANGKVYISTGNSTLDFHVINKPDSGGLVCDLQQHSLHFGCYLFRSNVFHPNYYLGPVTGSACDTLTGLNDHLNEIINFKLKPNPNNGSFSISYLLPQNKDGIFEVFDMVGRRVFTMPLPPWSTVQQIVLPKISDGIYNGVITSGGFRVGRKIVVIN